MSMNQSDLIETVYNKLDNVKKYVVRNVVREVLNTIVETTAKGNAVSFVGFGVFQPKVKVARQCRNPKTGEAMSLPERKVVRFRVGSKFKKAVAG